MIDLTEEPDLPPYFTEQYMEGEFVIRKTRSKHDWMRFQAGKTVVEHRLYASKAMVGRGFDGDVVIFHLMGCGSTEAEAIDMALKRR